MVSSVPMSLDEGSPVHPTWSSSNESCCAGDGSCMSPVIVGVRLALSSNGDWDRAVVGGRTGAKFPAQMIRTCAWISKRTAMGKIDGGCTAIPRVGEEGQILRHKGAREKIRFEAGPGMARARPPFRLRASATTRTLCGRQVESPGPADLFKFRRRVSQPSGGHLSLALNPATGRTVARLPGDQGRASRTRRDRDCPCRVGPLHVGSDNQSRRHGIGPMIANLK